MKRGQPGCGRDTTKLWISGTPHFNKRPIKMLVQPEAANGEPHCSPPILELELLADSESKPGTVLLVLCWAQLPTDSPGEHLAEARLAEGEELESNLLRVDQR